tara:strand:+ start:453 stop:1685 length:1233 start_codon:yes stop_codon:yes gene_type:complete
MAENIGKIQIAIEAQTADLKNGLKSAERAIKDSAKNMEESQSSLGKKISKSWTEMSSKLMLYEQMLVGAKNAVGALSDSMKILGDDSMESHNKTIALFDTFSDAGIPVVSAFIGLVRGLGYAFTDLKEVEQSVIETQKLLFEQKNMMALTVSIEREIELMKSQVEIQRMMMEVTEQRIRGESGIALQFDIQRKKMIDAFDAENKALEDRLKREGNFARFIQDQLERKKEGQLELLGILDEQEKQANRIYEAEQARLEVAKKLAETAELERIEKEKIDKAKANADKELDLQTKLNIMLAKQAGDEEKAKLLAIEHRYKKELEFATEAQKKILLQMKEIEIAGAMEKAIVAEPEVQKAMSGTASIATAIGGFTVATGVSKELKQAKKQTTLLETIAFNTSPKKGEMLISVAT